MLEPNMDSVDTRIRQATALIDDARCILADMSEELVSDPLEAARCSLNVSLCHLQVLERSL